MTTALIDFSWYYEPIRLSAPTRCVENVVRHTEMIDSVLALGSPLVSKALKSFFGLNISRDDDFVNALSIPLGSFQAQNWDELGPSAFTIFCDAIGGNGTEGATILEGGVVKEQIVLGPTTRSTVEAIHDTLSKTPPIDPRRTFSEFSAYATYIKEHVASLCPPEMTDDECFGSEGMGEDGEDSDIASWKSWIYQVCTGELCTSYARYGTDHSFRISHWYDCITISSEWGYFMPAPTLERPSLISRLITLEYTSKICRSAFCTSPSLPYRIVPSS